MARRLPSELDLIAGELRHDGLAQSHFEGKSVAIKNALPGEVVQSRVVGRRRGRWLAEAQHIANAHPERQIPVCEHFPRCGGCMLQHLLPTAQLTLKAKRLQQALETEGISDAPIPYIIDGPLTGYRSRARLGVRQLNSGVVVGFRESFSNRVLRMQSCQILVPVLAGAVRRLTPVLDELSIADRIPQLEVAAGDRHAEIVVRHLAPLAPRDIQLLESFESQSQSHSKVRIVLQSGGYETLRYLDGSDYGTNLGYANPDYGLYFNFSALDFTQINGPINRKLVRTAITELNPMPGERVLDLFCGIGNFTLPIARRGAWAIGFEGSAAAVKQARWNAEFNGIAHRSEFHSQDLYAVDAPAMPEAEKWLLDPPRSGAGPNLERWLSTRTQTLVYISCNPDSFALDAKRLRVQGMRLEKVGIYDMFPHTTHIESLGVFRRVSEPENLTL